MNKTTLTRPDKLKCSLTHPHKAPQSYASSLHIMNLANPDFALSPVYLSNPTRNTHWQLLCPDYICLLISILQADYIRCGYTSLKLSTSALDRRPIFTSFNLTLVSCQGENYAPRAWELVLNILLSGIKYIIIFLKTALPRSIHSSSCLHQSWGGSQKKELWLIQLLPP